MEPDPVKYDLDQLNTFIQFVFHVEQAEDEHIFVQVSNKAPKGFGQTPGFLFPRLKRTNAPMKGYFSTSTLAKTDGDLRHTKQAFKSYRVLVLDDVGTKIPYDKIPEGLAENYNIETSEGNHQLGYILAEPITDYEEAQMLIDLFVDAGLTDGGGAMPVKKVRLPCGVNGKRVADKEHFQVKLHELNDDYWDIQELLDAAGISVEWSEYRKQVRDVTRRTRRIGATAWQPDIFYHNPVDGVYDPVLEFMFKQGMVVQEAQEPFMDVICPFHDEHSDSDLQSKLCGYSPLGHGLYPHMRIFKCFHNACANRTKEDFLQEIHLMGGPLMPAREFHPEACMHLVFDKTTDRIYDLRQRGRMLPMTVSALNRITPKVRLPNGLFVEQIPLWLRQPSATVVSGALHDPGNRARLTVDPHGELRVNVFHMPEYAAFKPDPEVVQVFRDYLKYLFPVEAEHDYFLKWLACKVQHPTFRGAAVVLITQAQGTGKNTLMKMIGRLFGQYNVDQMNMDDLVAPKTAFNPWATKLFINVNESLATSNPNDARRAYNRLKEVVDPMAMEVTINEKYLGTYPAVCATSFLFFSNHSDAVYLQQGDRRFFAAQGPVVPADPAYFGMIHQWIRTDWMTHVWNHLMSIEVDLNDMMKAPEATDTMQEIQHETTSPIEAVIDAAIACWPCELVPPQVIKELLLHYVPRGVPENHNILAQRLTSDRLMSLRGRRGRDFDDRIKGRSHRLRDKHIYADVERLLVERDKALKFIETFDADAFRMQVDALLEERGFDF